MSNSQTSPQPSTSETVFRDFEVNTLDIYHKQLPLWQRPTLQALFALLAQFDCNALLSQLMPGLMPGIDTVQLFKSTEDALTQALKWFHDGGLALDVNPDMDLKLFQEAGEFCLHAGRYVNIADFHKMYGQNQVDIEVFETSRTVRFSPIQGNSGQASLCGMAEGAHRIEMLRGTMTESAKRTGLMPRQLSVKGAMQAIEYFTPAMMFADVGDVLYDAMLITVSTHRVANRPGRVEPRLKKRRPCWREMMTKPRNVNRRKLNAKTKA